LRIIVGLDVNKADFVTIIELFHNIAARAPCLKTFEFQLPLPDHDVRLALSELLAGLLDLKTVGIDGFLLCSEVIEFLAALQDLEEAYIICPQITEAEQGTIEYYAILPTLTSRAFSNIKVMDFKVPLASLSCFLNSPFPAAQL
jgi:hypothetical protein